MDPDKESWCRCILHVARRNSSRCNRQIKSKKTSNQKGCYNPYAVCSARLKTSLGRGKSCGDYYNYKNIPLDELRAYAELLNIKVSKTSTNPSTRSEIINSIKQYKKNKE